MKYTYTTLAILFFCGLLPGNTQASSAQLFTEDTAVFTLDFAVHNPKYINELPLAASSEIGYTDVVDYIGFTIEDTDGNKANATTKAILLSTEPIIGIRYKLSASSTPTFTLLMVVKFAEPVTSTYQARITKLPYWMNGRRTSVHKNQLADFPVVTLETK